MKYLYQLDYTGNHIRIINSASFPLKLLETIKELDLTGNPFSCMCDHKWFWDYLQTRNLTNKLRNWPTGYWCGSPSDLKYSHILQFHPTVSECSQMRSFYIITIDVCSVVIVFFFLIFIILKCQINIRNLIYFFRIRLRKGCAKIRSENDFRCHVCVVYCEADIIWVHETS